MMHVQLPDNRWITHSEAVTAFVYGEFRDASGLYPTDATDALLEELNDAALAGRVRFRALTAGNNKYQEIEPVYFSTRRSFDWHRNQIQLLAPVPYGEYEQEWVTEWRDVHLDRDQFASLLTDMGAVVEPNSDSDVIKKPKEIYRTGLQGRPTAVQLALPIAQSRLDAGDYPDTKKMFSEQIVDAVAKAHPQAARMKAKTLGNNPEFSELWRRKPPRPK